MFSNCTNPREKSSSRFGGVMRWLTVLIVAAFLAACSTPENTAFHSFSFDTRSAVPAVEVLDYQYGSSGGTGTRPPKWALDAGRPFYFDGVTGAIPVGDSLYVKWRIKATGEIREDTVDLRHRLPSEMKDKRVAFYIVGKQLYVYVADRDFLPVGAPEVIPPGAPIRDLPFTYHTKYQIIYPDQPKQ